MSRRRPATRKAKRTVTKASKATASKTKVTKATSPAQNSLEKSFSDLPAKLLAHFAKEVTSLKQAESKMKASLLKLKATMAKAKTGPKAKAAAKAVATLSKQLQDTASSLFEATQKQAKISALRKHLTSFEKEWAGKLKAMKAKLAAKAKLASKPKTKKTRKSSKAKAAQIIPLQQSTMESTDQSMEQSHSNNTAEMS